MSECSALIKLINRMNSAHYSECSPYSKIGNCRMGINEEVSEKCFFKNFLIQPNYTYERLATIIETSRDPSKNTIFITGYRVSGKTTFFRYLQAIIEKRAMLPPLDKNCEINISLNGLITPEQVRYCSHYRHKVRESDKISTWKSQKRNMRK